MKNKIQVFIFSTIIISLMLLGIFLEKKTYSEVERRYLATFPKLDLTFTNEIETYLEDHVPFRNEFLKLKGNTELYVLQKQDNNGYFIKNNYISKIDLKLNPVKVESFIQKVNQIKDKYLDEKPLNLTIIPDKNIYLDYPTYDFNQMVEIIKTNCDINYIDSFSYLSIDDYYQTDTHWKQENILKVKDQILKALNKDSQANYILKKATDDFLGVYQRQSLFNHASEVLNYYTNETIENSTLINQNKKELPIYNDHKLNSDDPYAFFLGGVDAILEMTSPINNQQQLIIFGDSFATSIAPLFLDSYSKVTLVDLRYINIDLINQFVDFNGDVLFLYSSLSINNLQ